MKLQADRMEGQNAISRHGPGGVIVSGVQYQSSVFISWNEGVTAWAVTDFEALTAQHFALLAPAQPEVVIFGSGSRLRFVHPALWTSLTQQRIGFETMDTAAACRTYNVLLAEGRRVVAALLFEPAL
jgi:uncharacterized protein